MREIYLIEQKPKKVLLAFDQATHSGVSVWDLKSKQLVAYADFEAKGKLLQERLRSFYLQVGDLFEEWNPSAVAFEEILKDADEEKGFKTQKILAYYQAVLYLHCEVFKIEPQIVVASAWKRVLGVKGNNRVEQKAACKQIINQKYKVDSQDTCDAIGIGFYCINENEELAF